MARLPGIVATALLATMATAQAEPGAAPAETIRLWKGDAPGALGNAEHDVPTIAWWPAPGAATAACVICPGGGYGSLADYEGSDYARWLTTRGISAFVLRYRLGTHGYRHPVMLGDAARAMRLIRHDHRRFRIDPARVGIVGSSAGGHLALTLCIEGDDGDPRAADEIDRLPSRPAVGVLCYPVVSMLAEKTHGGSRANLLGEAPDESTARRLSGELAAHERVPPLFIWHTFADNAVRVEPILELVARLVALKRPCELHVYESGAHGLGLGTRPFEPGRRLHPWTADCGDWLAHHGF